MKELRQKWYSIAQQVQEVLLKAVQKSGMTEQSKLKYTGSTTHLEVDRSINNPENHAVKNIAYVRKIGGIPKSSSNAEEERMISRFFELSENTKNCLENLRNVVKNKGINLKEFETTWHPSGIGEKSHGLYLEQFGDAVKSDFIRAIAKAAKKLAKEKGCIEEAAIHLSFSQTRIKSFYGRENLVKATHKYLSRKKGGGAPYIVYGASGAGKTSLMAKVVAITQEVHRQRDRNIIVRFCGTSSMSASAPGRTLSFLILDFELLRITLIFSWLNC